MFPIVSWVQGIHACPVPELKAVTSAQKDRLTKVHSKLVESNCMKLEELTQYFQLALQFYERDTVID
jgi:hypothetical protein